MRAGKSWFRATRNHIHHRLLALGFDHYQAVVAIYAVQTFFVVAAIVLRHDSDALVLALYAVPCAMVFALLSAAERGGWRLRRDGESPLSRLLGGDRAGGIAVALTAGIAVAIPAYLVAGGLAVRSLPEGVGPGLAVIVAVLAASAAFPGRAGLDLPARACLYGLAPLWVYGVERQLQALAPVALASTVPFYAALALAIALVWKLARDHEFAPTTMDFLIAVVAVGATVFAGSLAQSAQLASLLIKIVLLLYGCELVQTRARARRALHAAGAAAAAIALWRLAG
jgi:UDP-GlcNAc:undecaprenyl-phosphate GlcNAc-1-phosphate transferase